MRSVRIYCTAGLATLTLLAGCGGDDGKQAASKRSNVNLDRPVYPRCGVEGFPKPRVESKTSPDRNARFWSLSYLLTAPKPGYPPTAPRTLLIVEFSSALPRHKLPGIPEVRIAGRLVSFHTPDKKLPTYSAQWKTRRARYAVIADGSDTKRVKRLIACMP